MKGNIDESGAWLICDSVVSKYHNQVHKCAHLDCSVESAATNIISITYT